MPSLNKALMRSLQYTVLEPLRQEPRLLLLSLSTMSMTMAMGMVGPVLPLMVKSFGMTAAMVGFAVSAFAIARALSNIPAGLLTRKQGARFVLVLGAAISALGNLGVALVPSYAPLIAFRFVAGLGSALFITAAVIFVAEVSTPENRGRFMTIYQFSFLFGISIGPSMGGIVAQFFGLAAPFLLVAAISAFAGIWAFLRIPADVARVNGDGGQPAVAAQPQPPSARNGALVLLRNPSFIVVNFVALGIFFTRGGALQTLWPVMGKERFFLDPAQLGLVLSISSVTNLITQPFVAGMIDRVGRKALIIPTTFLFAFSTFLSAVSPTVGVFAIALTFYGIGQAMESPSANTYVSDLTTRDQRALALSIHRTFGDVGMVVGAPLLGFVADQAGIPTGLIVNAMLVAIPGVVFAIVAKETFVRRQAPVAVEVAARK